ncbi:MAG: hypothetical protein IJ649_00160 [Oscillospiraceae bacterium]|nr:hypothetical protein [Oscillospiraceae bacterium]
MSIIAVDFDGCLCRNAWPEIGEANWEVIHALVERQAEGDKVILWTCRVDDKLEAAVAWCINRGIKFDAVNANLPEMIDKFGNDCRKVFANEYWDDRSVMVRGEGTPLMAWFQEDKSICVRRWYRGTVEVQDDSLVGKLKRRWRKWRFE